MFSFKKKSVPVIAGLVAVLLLLVALYFFMKRGRMEGFSTETVVTYFFMPNCPWCQKFKPEWDKFKAEADASGIKTEEIDATDDKNAKLVSDKGVTGFPTVIVTVAGKDNEYNGERTAADLMKFVKGL